jgi:hypothetical protein
MLAQTIRARVRKTKKVYVHNDLSQAATYFNETAQVKFKKGERDGIKFDGMATALMVAFAFEAKLNFMGSQLKKANKLTSWNEFQSFEKKRKIVLNALGMSTDVSKRPLAAMERMKKLRDTLAHGKPIELVTEEIVVGTPEEIDLASGAELWAGWENDCTPQSVAEALGDLDVLWKEMMEKSGLGVFDTMTQGEGSIDVIS